MPSESKAYTDVEQPLFINRNFFTPICYYQRSSKNIFYNFSQRLSVLQLVKCVKKMFLSTNLRIIGFKTCCPDSAKRFKPISYHLKLPLSALWGRSHSMVPRDKTNPISIVWQLPYSQVLLVIHFVSLVCCFEWLKWILKQVCHSRLQIQKESSSRIRNF